MTSIFDTTRKIDALRAQGVRLRLEDAPVGVAPPWRVDAFGPDVVEWNARAPTVEAAVDKAWRAFGSPGEPPVAVASVGFAQVRVTRSALERLQKDHPGLTGHTARDLVASSKEVPPTDVWPLLGRRHDSVDAERTVYLVTPARVGVLVLVPDRERTDGRLACVTYLPLREDKVSQARRLWP